MKRILTVLALLALTMSVVMAIPMTHLSKPTLTAVEHPAISVTPPTTSAIRLDRPEVTRVPPPATQVKNWCDLADIDDDGTVNQPDLGILLSNWGRKDCDKENGWCDASDVNTDGRVNHIDLGFVKLFFGEEC